MITRCQRDDVRFESLKALSLVSCRNRIMDQHFFVFIAFYFLTFLVYTGNFTLLTRTKRDGHDWSYGGHHGPSHWGGVCSTGKRQSPINIVSSNTREESFEPLYFGDSYSTYLNFEALNNGHTLVVSSPNATAIPTFQGGGLDGKYVFQQLHFHWESEHQIDGERAALEMHLVHYNSKYRDIGIASLASDGLAVIAVLCDESEEPDHELEDLLENALFNAVEKQSFISKIISEDTLFDPVLKGKKIDEKRKLNYRLRDMLPANVDRWFRYDGSLTTPGCDESVIWTVLLNRMHVSKKILNTLRQLRDKDGMELAKNYRPIQELNGRTIFLQVDESMNVIPTDEDKSKTGSSTTIYPNSVLFGFVTVLYIALNHRNSYN